MSDDEPLRGASYTRARRHPMLIGKFQGFTLPFMVSLAQVGVFVGGVIFLVETRNLWGQLAGSKVLQAFIVLAIPTACAVALRHLRMEGRSPLRMACGVGVYLGRRGVGASCNGRPVREGRRRLLCSRKVFVTAVLPPTARVTVRPGPTERVEAAAAVRALLAARRVG